MIKHGELRWAEDDATCHGDPDHETLDRAWLRLFSEKLDTKTAIESDDQGDGVWYLMPNRYVVLASSPGNSAIYAPEPRNEAAEKAYRSLLRDHLLSTNQNERRALKRQMDGLQSQIARDREDPRWKAFLVTCEDVEASCTELKKGRGC